MFFHVVSLSNSSLEPRLRRNSRVTGACCSVNRIGNGHAGQMLFSVGRGWCSSMCCALFRGVFDASVVAVEDQLCVRGFGLS